MPPEEKQYYFLVDRGGVYAPLKLTQQEGKVSPEIGFVAQKRDATSVPGSQVLTVWRMLSEQGYDNVCIYRC